MSHFAAFCSSGPKSQVASNFDVSVDRAAAPMATASHLAAYRHAHEPHNWTRASLLQLQTAGTRTQTTSSPSAARLWLLRWGAAITTHAHGLTADVIPRRPCARPRRRAASVLPCRAALLPGEPAVGVHGASAERAGVGSTHARLRDARRHSHRLSCFALSAERHLWRARASPLCCCDRAAPQRSPPGART